MRSLLDLKGIHEGRAAAVLGGGPSLPGQLELIPGDAVIIGVNHHAPRIIDCDCIVFNDAGIAARVARFPGVKLSILPHLSDVDLRGSWNEGFSSSTAAFLALWMGGDPVILAGMDCRQGEHNYFHSPEMGFEGMPPGHLDLEKQTQAWRRAFDHCPHPERILAAGGPLVDVFGRYERGEGKTGEKENHVTAKKAKGLAEQAGAGQGDWLFAAIIRSAY